MFLREMRNIIPLGISSKGISLPKNWIDIHALNNGDNIEIITTKDIIVVLPPNTSKTKLKEIEDLLKEVL